MTLSFNVAQVFAYTTKCLHCIDLPLEADTFFHGYEEAVTKKFDPREGEAMGAGGVSARRRWKRQVALEAISCIMLHDPTLYMERFCGDRIQSMKRIAILRNRRFGKGDQQGPQNQNTAIEVALLKWQEAQALNVYRRSADCHHELPRILSLRPSPLGPDCGTSLAVMVVGRRYETTGLSRRCCSGTAQCAASSCDGLCDAWPGLLGLPGPTQVETQSLCAWVNDARHV